MHTAHSIGERINHVLYRTVISGPRMDYGSATITVTAGLEGARGAG